MKIIELSEKVRRQKEELVDKKGKEGEKEEKGERVMSELKRYSLTHSFTHSLPHSLLPLLIY